MTISLSDAGKRFNRDWIFRHFTYQFEAGQSYAITGPNGSGKSTLLQALSGSMYINEGKIVYHYTDQSKKQEDIYREVSICAPYLEVVEEMNIREFLEFHRAFKQLLPGHSADSIIKEIGLFNAVHKQIRYFSSGMKQRVKLAQCIFSDTPIVLLDEPCTNLDHTGIELYQRLISTYCRDRLVVVSSNDETEYLFCQHKINICDYK